MKSKTTLQFHSTLATTIFCGALLTHLATSSASAQALSWDGSDIVTSGAQGGTGTWDSNTTANWWDGAADVVWPNSGTDNDAIFGGTAGTVTISSVTANDLTFNSNGYILSGASTLTLNGTTPTITTNASSPATIGNATDTVLAGSAGLVKAGTNTLTINGSAVNTFTGGLNVKAGTLNLNHNNLATPTNLINSGNALSLYNGGSLVIIGKDSVASSQTFNGTSIYSGNSVLTLTPGAGVGTTITGTYGTVTQAEAGGVVSFANATSTTRFINVSNPISSYIGSWAYVGDQKATGGRYANVNASGQVLSITGTTATASTMANVTSATTVFTANGSFTAGGALTAFGVQNTTASTWALGANTLTTNGILGISSTLAITGTAGVVVGAGNELVIAGAGTVTISAPILNKAASNSNLTYAGGGSLILQTSASAYSGQTTVNSGKMTISTGGSINSSNGIRINGGTFVQANTATAVTPAVTLQGGILDGTGTVNTVNVADLATAKITNGNATTTALTVGNLTFSGDAAIDVRTAGSAGLAVSGTLTTTPANGTITVNVTSAPVWIIGNTYNLISYGTLAGSLADFTKGTIAGLGGRQTASLVTSGNNIAVLIGGDKALWTGAASGNWTTTAIPSPFNWKTQLGGADTDFLATDDAVFDDTAILTAVTISDATVSPTSTTFNNSTKSYTISGGGIATGNLTKNGTNSLSLTNSNTYTGATTINGGSLQISGGAAIANAGLVTLANTAGATFQVSGSETIGALSGGGGAGGAVSIDASQTLTLSSGIQTFAGAVSGAGTLTGAGAVQTLSGVLSQGGGLNATSGALTLSNGSNSYTGTTLLSATVTAGAGILVTANGALGAIGAGNGTTIIGVPVSGVTTSQLGFSGSINYSMAEKITGSGVGGAANVGPFIATQRGFIQSVGGNNTFAGDIELSANGISRIGTQDGASLTLTGAITQASGVTTASILFRPGSTAGDFVTLSNAGNSLGGNSSIFSGASTGYAGVRLGITNGLPTNLSISSFAGTNVTTTALDLAGYNQSLNGLVTGAGAGALSIINMNTGTPSTLTLNPTVDKSTSNTLILGSGGLGVINLVKDGAFTQTLAGISTYTGSTTVTGGTLALGASNVLPDTAISIGNATLDAATFTDTLGTLDVTSTAKINLGSGATLAFAPASPAWTGTLNITGTFVSGSSLKFGSDVNGLTGTQLSLISATGFTGFGLDANGFLTATPAGGYSAWASLNGAGANLNDDHDSDGVDNGTEYFIGGTTGNTTGFTPLPGVVDTAGTLSVTWTKAASYTGTYGTDFVVETSATLANPWATEASPGTVTITGNDVKFTFPGGTKNFARLKVTGP